MRVLSLSVFGFCTALLGGCSGMSPETSSLLDSLGKISSSIPVHGKSVSRQSSSNSHQECHFEGSTKVCHAESSGSHSSISFGN
jgi:hypothetical protein